MKLKKENQHQREKANKEGIGCAIIIVPFILTFIGWELIYESLSIRISPILSGVLILAGFCIMIIGGSVCVAVVLGLIMKWIKG